MVKLQVKNLAILLTLPRMGKPLPLVHLGMTTAMVKILDTYVCIPTLLRPKFGLKLGQILMETENMIIQMRPLQCRPMDQQLSLLHHPVISTLLQDMHKSTSITYVGLCNIVEVLQSTEQYHRSSVIQWYQDLESTIMWFCKH
jgi:hypothetical protein